MQNTRKKSKPRKAAKKAARKPGRPSLYSEKLAAEILRRTAEGETLTSICNDARMPNRSNVWEWQKKHPEFRDGLARAREEQAWSWSYQAIDIADGAGSRAYGEPGTGEAGARVMAEKLRIDTRKWFAAKLCPKQFGEKVSQEISGPDGGPLENILSITPEIEDRIKRLGMVRATMKPPHGYESTDETGQAET